MPISPMFMTFTAKAQGWMRYVLDKIHRAPPFTGEPYFAPYVEAFRKVAEERGLDLGPVEGAEKFVEVWDARARDVLEWRAAELHYTAEEEKRFLEILRVLAEWAVKNFPEAK